MTAVLETLRTNLKAVQSRIDAAAARSGRSSTDVRLVVVTKYAPLEAVRLLPELGVLDLGESRPQQLVERRSLIPQARWHLIGHLQRNKVRLVLPAANCIHSVDSLRLLKRIGEESQAAGVTSRVLLEVNVSGESQKDGFTPDELRACWEVCCETPQVVVVGLMTMAPASEDPEDSRPVFRRLRELRDELNAAGNSSTLAKFTDLSMGMSGDYDVAIEEGATIVRVGSALFEGIESE